MKNEKIIKQKIRLLLDVYWPNYTELYVNYIYKRIRGEYDSNCEYRAVKYSIEDRYVMEAGDEKLTSEELSEKIGLKLLIYKSRNSLEDLKKFLSKKKSNNEKITSVDSPIGGEGDKPLVDILADVTSADPATVLLDNDLRACLDDWINELSETQQAVLARRFGLRGFDSATLEEVGHEIGLTRERVRQIQVEALKTLRRVIERHGLSDDLVRE